MNCPKCKTDLKTNTIYKIYRENYCRVWGYELFCPSFACDYEGFQHRAKIQEKEGISGIAMPTGSHLLLK